MLDYKTRFIDRLATAFGAHNMLDVNSIIELNNQKRVLENELMEVCVNPGSESSSGIIAVHRHRKQMDDFTRKRILDALSIEKVLPIK